MHDVPLDCQTVNFWLPTPMAPVLHQVTFSVRLRPKGWTRASPFLKGGRLIVSKNQGDRDWQAYFREEFIRKMSHQQLLGLFPWSGPVIMQNFFLYLPPKNWWPGKEKVTTPDDDNLAKQVADALSPKAAHQWTPKGCKPEHLVPDAHDPAKRHAPMMSTADLALRMDPVYEKIARRFSNISKVSGANAASAACWAMVDGQINKFCANFSTSRKCVSGTIIQPSRQPVIPKYFEKLLMTKISLLIASADAKSTP